MYIDDPPASSFPACIAVKNAELQSAAWGARYLELARRAVMTGMKNIARVGVLLALASKLAFSEPGFDVGLFGEDLDGRGIAAFRNDWTEVRYLGIVRFPTFVIRMRDRPAIMLRGFQRYEELVGALGATGVVKL